MMSNSNFANAPLPLKMIPKDWNCETMEQLMEFKNGYAFKSKDYSDSGKTIVRMSNISVTGTLQINKDNVRYCTIEDYMQLDLYHLSKGDLVICMTDVTPEKAIVGRTAVIDKSNSYILNQRVGRIRVNKRIDNIFLHYYTNSEQYLKYIRNMTSGSAQFNLSTKDIKNTVVPVPPIKEQQKIAAILSSVDEAIEKTEQIIEQTETVKKGLMQQLLTKGIGNKEFKQSPIGEVPRTWSVKPLGDVVLEKPTYGSGDSAQDYDINKPRYIRITDITEDGFLNENDLKSVKYDGNEKYLLKKGDLLFARTGNTVGKSYIYREKEGFAVYAGYLIRFKVDENIVDPEFIFHITHSSYYYNWVKSMLRTGAQPNINAQEYSSLLIPVPSKEEQNYIIKILKGFQEKILSEKQYLNKLETIKQGLMQQLLTGKVRVPLDDKEEVPS